MKTTEWQFCKNCTYPLESNTSIEERMDRIDLVDVGKHIYYAILDKKFKSINLCNLCYTTMQTYRQSLSKEERKYYEKY